MSRNQNIPGIQRLKQARRTGAMINWALFIVVMMHNLAFGKPINDVSRKFTFNIPDTFVETSEFSKKPETLYAFKQNSPPVFIVISEVPGAIGQDNAGLAEAAAKRDGKPFVLPWKTFELIGLELSSEQSGMNVAAFFAQVPLLPRAIQVSVLGPPTEQEQLKSLLKQVVRSVDGETNWLPPALAWLRSLLIPAGLAALIAAFFFGRRKKTSPQI